MGRYFRGGIIFIWVFCNRERMYMNRNCRLKYSLSLRAFAGLTGCSTCVRFFHSLAVVLLTTNLAHVDERNCHCCTCVCYGFELYTRRYTHVGGYNRELSIRWSFGSLYSRRCYFTYSVLGPLRQRGFRCRRGPNTD